MSVLRTTLATALVSVVGLGVAHHATDGFAAFTLESARRIQALRAPVAVPDVALELTSGGAHLSDLPARILLVDFIYTRCTTYCSALGSVYTQLQHRLAPEIAAGEVGLLSITFDPSHDTLDTLRDYRARHSNASLGWELGRPTQKDELARTLRAFGVVVIPDEWGGFTHNAAIQVLGPERRLIAIHDFNDLDGVILSVQAALKKNHVAQR